MKMHLCEDEGVEARNTFVVTGGLGFVGAALCLELLRRGAHQVRAFDLRSHSSSSDNLKRHGVVTIQEFHVSTFCHSHGILHRDLKPHNLLMNRSTMTLKIADLGLARAFIVPMKKYTHELLKFFWGLPTILPDIDMWYVACIFAELVTTQALFPGDSELQQLLHIFRLLGTPNEEVWPDVNELMNWHEYPQWKPQSLSSAVP